ncbi:hypothetical protein PLEOSDRAFT_1104869 [Pleurotus ostreatus PC15]|uniref:Uncharacterized protein n=1 Tax=Pleurotus ostreatus (strain PC15) TaxID=1137138 RepID=A0A067NJR3_PLEO1|nr:hypothetical protein PLEOSDRAFT_1104869 [Pleurotus ostreatus PC15]
MDIPMDFNTLSALKRNELQKLAMAHSIKANQKSATLVALLLAKHAKQAGEQAMGGKGEQTNLGTRQTKMTKTATARKGTRAAKKRGRAATNQDDNDNNAEADDAQAPVASEEQGQEAPGPSKRLRPRRGQPAPVPSKVPPSRPSRLKAPAPTAPAPTAPAPTMGPPPFPLPPPPPPHLPAPHLPAPHRTPPRPTPVPNTRTRYSPASTPSVVSARSRHYTPTSTPTTSFLGVGARFHRFHRHHHHNNNNNDDDDDDDDDIGGRGGSGGSGAPPTLERRKSSRIPRHADIVNMHVGRGQRPSPPSPSPARPRGSLPSRRPARSETSESRERASASVGAERAYGGETEEVREVGEVRDVDMDGRRVKVKKLVLVVKQEEDSDEDELALPVNPYVRGVSNGKGKEREREREQRFENEYTETPLESTSALIAEREEAARAQAEGRSTPRAHEQQASGQGVNWDALDSPVHSPSSPPWVVPPLQLSSPLPPTPDYEFHRDSTPEARQGAEAVGTERGAGAEAQPRPQSELEQQRQVAAWTGATRAPSPGPSDRSPSYGFTTPTHSPLPSLYSPSSPRSPASRPAHSHYVSPPASPGGVHETVALLRVLHDRDAALHDQVAALRAAAQGVRAQAVLLVERLRAEAGEARRMEGFARYWRGGGYYRARGVDAEDPGCGVTAAARGRGLGGDVAGRARNGGVNGDGGGEPRAEWRPDVNWMHEEVWGGEMRVLRALKPEEQFEITSEDEGEGGILDRLDNGDDLGIGMQRVRGEAGVLDTLGVGAEVPEAYLEARRREEAEERERERERERMAEEEMLQGREEEDMLERKRENQRAAKGKRKADDIDIDPVEKAEERMKRKRIFSQA